MKVVDLTLEISSSLKVFPGSPQPCFVPWTNMMTHGYDSEAILMSTHTGTHMDAPSHFVPGKPSIDKIPAARFVSDAMLVRIPKKAGELVEARDFRGTDIRKNDSVVISTGWEKKIRSRNYMTANPGESQPAPPSTLLQGKFHWWELMGLASTQALTSSSRRTGSYCPRASLQWKTSAILAGSAK